MIYYKTTGRFEIVIRGRDGIWDSASVGCASANDFANEDDAYEGIARLRELTEFCQADLRVRKIMIACNA